MNTGHEFFCGSISDDYQAILEGALLANDKNISDLPGTCGKNCSNPTACPAPGTDSKGCSHPHACPAPGTDSKGCSKPEVCPPPHKKAGGWHAPVPGWSTPPLDARPRVY